MKILIVRTDRLGDVLLTTPVAAAIKNARPDTQVAFLVRPYAAPLLANNPDIDLVFQDSGGPLGSLVERIRAERFDAAIVALPRWRAVWAVWRAGIPIRIGPASKWYSLLFNRRVWQHRSEGKKHEADYNLDLLNTLGIESKVLETKFIVSDDERSKARRFLESMRVGFQKPLVVLHPGSGGSSARWPLSHFMELGDRLQEGGCDVVVTAGPGEDYQNVMIDQMRRVPIFVAAGSVSVRELAALLANADLVVANSTGPLHLAVAVGTPTVSIFSPVPACHPRRWGPYPAYPQGDGRHAVALAPEGVQAEVDLREVSVEFVLKLCQERLARKGGAEAARLTGA